MANPVEYDSLSAYSRDRRARFGPAPQPVSDVLNSAQVESGRTAPGSTTSPSTATGTSGTPPADWRQYLVDWGFDQDIVNELDRIFRTYTDTNAAGSAALAYIRGTTWYANTFPGIQEGEKLGIITNEQDYRSYTNQMNDVYQRYYGRNVSGQEVAQALVGGKTVGHINAELEGGAFIKANQGDLQYEQGAFGTGRFSDAELKAYGEQQAGLDNALGQEIGKRVSLAHQRLQTIFQGTLASPGLSLGKFGRVTAPSLAGGNTEDLPT